MVIPVDADPGTSVPKRGAVKETSTGGATILLVEDDPTLAAMLRDRLGARGHTVRHAATGAEALGDAVTPDLVIVDLMRIGPRLPTMQLSGRPASSRISPKRRDLLPLPATVPGTARIGAPGVVAIGVIATAAVAPAVATWTAAPPATP
jgi:CheY-like chemotaxis protein